MFAVFAMQLFGGHYNSFSDGKPRSNFDSFTQAWLTIFQVSSGDQWMNITWEAMRLQWVLFPPLLPHAICSPLPRPLTPKSEANVCSKDLQPVLTNPVTYEFG